jgi:hypothetical protein
LGQVGELIQGPGGQYLTVIPNGQSKMLAMRADELLTIAKTDYNVDKSYRPRVGELIILGGIAEGAVKIGKEEAIVVHPLLWVPGRSPSKPDTEMGVRAPASVEKDVSQSTWSGPSDIESHVQQFPGGTADTQTASPSDGAVSKPPKIDTANLTPGPGASHKNETEDTTPPPSPSALPQPPMRPTGTHKEVEFFGL